MNTARLLVPIFTLQDFLYLLLDFLLAGFFSRVIMKINFCHTFTIESLNLEEAISATLTSSLGPSFCHPGNKKTSQAYV